MKLILRCGVEMSGFGVGVRGLGNGGAKVDFLILLLLLGSRVRRLRCGFQVVNSGGNGIDHVYWLGVLLFSRVKDG